MKNYFNNKKFMELLHGSTMPELKNAVRDMTFLRAKAVENKLIYELLSKAINYVNLEWESQVKGTHFFMEEDSTFSCSKEEIEALPSTSKTLAKSKELRRIAGERKDFASYKMLHLLVSMCKAYGD